LFRASPASVLHFFKAFGAVTCGPTFFASRPHTFAPIRPPLMSELETRHGY